MKTYRTVVWSLSISGLAALAAWGWSGCGLSSDPEEGSLVAARESDPAWATTHREVAIIRVGQKGQGGNLHNFCVNQDGNVLACWGSSPTAVGSPAVRVTGGPAPTEKPAIRVFSPEGALLKTWPLEAQPQAICVHSNGTIFVGGDGRLFKLNQEGKVLASADSPALAQTVSLSKQTLEGLRQGGQASQDEITRYKGFLEERKRTITGLAVTDQDLFVVCPSVSDFTFVVYRFDHDLKNPKRVLEGLRGCCGQMDLQASDGRIWIPHNARHRVECHDRDGKQLTTFGKHDPRAADGFGGCCEPKNLRLVNGDIYTAESGPPVAIKHFSKDGKFREVVALPNFRTSCVRVTTDVSPDGKRWYILNTTDDAIHVLMAKN